MTKLSVRCRRLEAFTLVELRLRTDCPHRIRVDIPTDVTVWPPRSHGEKATGWDERGFTGVIDRGLTGLGFATPDEIESSAIELTGSEPVRSTGTPDGIAAWFRRIDARLRRGERLQEARTVQAAADEIASIGGMEAAMDLAEAIERDRQLLSRLDTVPGSLHRRLEAIDLDTESYEKLS